ncbi:MAG TPA: hypothetical protein VGB52_15350 [Actinomycetota bacterium]
MMTKPVPSARSEGYHAEVGDEPSAGGRLLLGWILIGVAVVMLIAGWIGVSANPAVAVQLSYFFSGGMGGLLAGIIGIGLLVSDDIRRDRARIGKLEATVLEMRELLLAQAELLQGLEGDARETPPEEPRPPARRSRGGGAQRR